MQIDSFTKFLPHAVASICPSRDLFNNWHIKLICQYLEAMENDEIKRLIINMPPRHSKSICVSAAWPAWLLGKDPTKKIVVASYAQHLSQKHAQDSRIVMHSSWFQTLFPEARIAKGENTKDKFVMTQRGFRIATSVFGAITGEGGDLLIVDDPHTPMQVSSNKSRKRILEWFDQTFFTRLNSPSRGKIIIVMHRLDEEDLTGYLLKKHTKWELLSLPIFSESNTDLSFKDFKTHWPAFEPLNKDLMSFQDIIEVKNEIGSFAFAAQFMQCPIARNKTGFIKDYWLSYFEKIEGMSLEDNFERIRDLESCYCYQSWDCAFKTGDSNSYSVCSTWLKYRERFYLINVLRNKMEFQELRDEAIKLFRRYKPNLILIEDAASGQVIAQELERYNIRIERIKPREDKISRFIRTLPLFESNRISLLKNAGWNAEFMEELLQFPHGKYNDQVDSVTQFLNFCLNEAKPREFRISSLL